MLHRVIERRSTVPWDLADDTLRDWVIVRIGVRQVAGIMHRANDDVLNVAVRSHRRKRRCDDGSESQRESEHDADFRYQEILAEQPSRHPVPLYAFLYACSVVGACAARQET